MLLYLLKISSSSAHFCMALYVIYLYTIVQCTIILYKVWFRCLLEGHVFANATALPGGRLEKVNSQNKKENCSHLIKKPQQKLKQFCRHQKVQLSFSGCLLLCSWDFQLHVFPWRCNMADQQENPPAKSHCHTLKFYMCGPQAKQKIKWCTVPYTTSTVSTSVSELLCKILRRKASEVPLQGGLQMNSGLQNMVLMQHMI